MSPKSLSPDPRPQPQSMEAMEEFQLTHNSLTLEFEMNDPVEMSSNSRIIDLTGDNTYEATSATTAISVIKDEPSDQLPDLNIDDDLSEFDFMQIDEHQRQLDAEKAMLGIEEAARSYQDTLNVNPPSTSEFPTAEDPFDSDAEDAEAAAVFKAKKIAYRRRQGSPTVEEVIEYSKLEQTEQERLRRQRKKISYQTAQQNDEESMFFPENNDRSSPTPSRPEVSDPELAALLMANDSDVEAVEGPSKAFRKSKQSKRKTPAINKVSKSGVKKPQPAAKEASRKAKKREIGYMNFDSLFNHNLIVAAQANEGKQTQPTFTSKNKKNALTELISSLPEDQRRVHMVDRRELDNATRKFNGHGVMKADGEGGWRLKGMKSSLKHFQLLGVAFMRDRENSSSKPFGGFISDDMGLRKTVACIANAIDGRATGNSKATATLVVAPPALLSQWMAELEKHAQPNALGSILVYRTGSWLLASDPVSTLSGMGVVITSYNEILRSWPKNNPPVHLQSETAKTEWYKKHCEENKGLLHRVSWRRVYLDEAQAIKNHMSQTSQAVSNLRPKYRWAISGTPIQNRLEELYAYWRFLELPHTGSYELFKVNFCKRGSNLALCRIQAYLNKYMLRRTHGDQIFGAPILQLPEVTSNTIVVEFNEVEKIIYRIIKERFVNKIGLFARAGSADKKYHSIFVLLLRLRQMVGHILLIQDTLKELLEPSDLERLWNLTKNEDIHGQGGILKGLEVALSKVRPGDTSATTHQEDASVGHENEARPSTAQNSGPAFRFRRYLKTLRDNGSQPHITSCCHIYCFECLNNLHHAAAMSNSNEASRCLECGCVFNKAEPFWGYEDASNDRSTTLMSVRSSTRYRGVSGADENDADWFTVPRPMIQSAKTKAAVLQIAKWRKEDPQSRIIVFTQFRGLIKVMSRLCAENDWGHASFTGDMSFAAREQAITRFRKPDGEYKDNEKKCVVLLASLKAGGVGLNLTAGNRVILLDLWWNSSVETQAFFRVFRIGQLKPCELIRFVVKDTIDEDILAMQEAKDTEIDRAIDSKNRPGRLSTADLLALFAVDLERDASGNPTGMGQDEGFILSEDPYHVVEDFANDSN